MNQVQFNQFWLEYERHFTACVQASPQRYDHTVEEAPLIARQVRERCLCEGISSLDIDSESFRLTCRTLGIEHTCEAIEHFLSQGTASLSDLNTVDNPDQEVSPIDRATAERWARDWFAGSAYCPRCANDYTIFADGVSTDAQSRIETWHCHRCTHSWKLEFRESAAAADSDAQPLQWIEREQIESDLSAKESHPPQSASVGSSMPPSLASPMRHSPVGNGQATPRSAMTSSTGRAGSHDDHSRRFARECAAVRRSYRRWRLRHRRKPRLCSKEARQRIESHRGRDALALRTVPIRAPTTG